MSRAISVVFPFPTPILGEINLQVGTQIMPMFLSNGYVNVAADAGAVVVRCNLHDPLAGSLYRDEFVRAINRVRR